MAKKTRYSSRGDSVTVRMGDALGAMTRLLEAGMGPTEIIQKAVIQLEEGSYTLSRSTVERVQALSKLLDVPPDAVVRELVDRFGGDLLKDVSRSRGENLNRDASRIKRDIPQDTEDATPGDITTGD